MDWSKYEYTYRLWGRLLYNPDSPPQSWQRYMQAHFGSESEAAEAALASASRILPLVTTAHLPSAANNSYWPEIYTNMPIVKAGRKHPYGDTPSPKVFGTVSPLDPQLFLTIEQFVDELLSGHPSGKYSPAQVAQWLIGFSDEASRRVGRVAPAHGSASAERRRLITDVTIQAGLGRFFAWKLRAGIVYGLYERTGDTAAIREALNAYRTAREAWKETGQNAQGVYVPDVTFGLERQLRGHWSDRIAAIDQDIADVEAKATQPPANAHAAGDVSSMIAAVLKVPTRPRLPVEHTPMKSFRQGEDVGIELRFGELAGAQRPSSARLWYRHVNQAEPWQVHQMEGSANKRVAAVPGSYSRSPFPLQYYFEVQDGTGSAWLYPGFEQGLMSQPYFVIRQAN